MHPVLAAVAARQGGVFTRAQALRCGYSPKSVEWALRSRRWVALRRGCYADGRLLASVIDLPGPCHALSIAAARLSLGTDSVASHESAALLLGLEVLSGDCDPAPFALTRPHEISGSYRHGDVRLMSAPLRPEEIETRHGVPVTRPARTLVDIGRQSTLRAVLVTADSALRQGLVTPPEIAAALERAAHWPGTGHAQRWLPHADGRSETPIESLGRAIFIQHQLPMPELQVDVGDADGYIGRVDFLWRKQGVVGEADGMTKYDDPMVLRAEKLRQERLEAAGFIVVRYWWDQAFRTPDQVALRFLRALSRGDRAAA